MSFSPARIMSRACSSPSRAIATSSGAGFLRELERAGPIASVSGRYWAMDRDKRWDRVRRAYEAMVAGDAPRVGDAAQAVEESYARGVTDEFIEPRFRVRLVIMRSMGFVAAVVSKRSRWRSATGSPWIARPTGISQRIRDPSRPTGWGNA